MATHQSITSMPFDTIGRPVLTSGWRCAVKRTLSAYALSIPAIVLMVIMLIAPLVSVFILALTDYQLGAPTFEFIGLRDFNALLCDSRLLASPGDTLLYAAFCVPSPVTLGLRRALLVRAP